MTNVLLIYHEMIPSVILAGHSQFSWLADNGMINYRSCRTRELNPKVCGWADIAVFVRSDDWICANVAKALKAAGKYLIYVLDDDLLNIPSYLSSAEHYGLQETRRHIENMMDICDCFMSPSKKLLEKYGKCFSKTVLMQEPVLGQCVKRAPSNREKLKIGFAGSIDRANDVDALLDSAIGALSEKYGDKIEFEFFGAKPALVEKYALKWYPYCDSYDEYQNKLQELDWDIALAPMPDTPFHACKHYIKLIEYSRLSLPAVFSDVTPYRGAVENGVTGILCENTPEAWFLAISQLIENRSLSMSVADNLYMLATEKFSLAAVAGVLIDSIPKSVRAETGRAPINLVKLLFIKYKARTLFQAVKKHGMRTPVVAVKKWLKLSKNE